MMLLVLSLAELNPGADGAEGYDTTVLLHTIYGAVQSCAKLALIGMVIWLCVRTSQHARRQLPGSVSGTPQSMPGTSSDTHNTTEIDARRKSVWEQKQTQMDKLSAAAISAKNERSKMKEEMRVAASAVKEAKERAYKCTRTADAARLLRRRAVDQLRLSKSDKDRTWAEETLREVAEREREEAHALLNVESAVVELKNLQDILAKFD